MGNKSRPESRVLAAEAERRAREGQSFASISRALGVPLSTLNYWALYGRFRRCDLDEENGPEQARLAAERIAEQRAQEARRQEEALAGLEALIAQLYPDGGEAKTPHRPDAESDPP